MPSPGSPALKNSSSGMITRGLNSITSSSRSRRSTPLKIGTFSIISALRKRATSARNFGGRSSRMALTS